MFESLKKKFAGWFGKKEKIEEEAEEKKESEGIKERIEAEEPRKKETKEEIIEKLKSQSERKPKKKEETKAESLPQLPPIEKEPIEEAPIEKIEVFPTEPAKPSRKAEAPAKQEQTPKVNIQMPSEEDENEKPGFFSRLIKKIIPTGTTTLNKEHIDEIFMEIELTLLENNVALEVVDKIRKNLNEDLLGIEVKKDKVESTILQSLKTSILEVLMESPNLEEQIKSKLSGPFVIIFFGINGSGKTTSIAKLAYRLQKNKISCIMAAADTFRAASIEQLETHGKNLGIPVIKQKYGSDPAAVAFDAVKYAQAHKIQAVLIDTAGRMYTKTNLIKEMEKIIRIAKPDLKIFVGESITGNDATEQAKTFNEAVGIDGIILSKADVDEKAGTILSVSYVTDRPIYFLGMGQGYEDLKPFSKATILKNIGLE